jgi:hypothetical protein
MMLAGRRAAAAAAAARGAVRTGTQRRAPAAGAAPPGARRPLHASPPSSSSDDGIVPTTRVNHAYTTGGRKYLPGFSFPAPRKLEHIIKYALLEREPPARIREVWNSFHDARLDSVATVWAAAEWAEMAARARRCPRFVYPVLKGDGKYFTLIAEWQDNFCIFTFLEDYRRNPSGAEPYMSVAVYPDFLDRKGIALVRGDFSGHLLKRDAVHILNLMRHFYLTEPRHLETFNRDPAAFDWAAFVSACPQPPAAGTPDAGAVVRDKASLPGVGGIKV